MAFRRLLFSLALFLSPAAAQAGNGLIATIAGNGQSGYSGDGGLSTSARLSFPIRSVTTPDGGALIADEANNVIRYIRPDGVIRTVAGVAGPGSFAGDGGPATSARLNQPTGVHPLPNGGFLIADRGNRRIRRVSVGGIISTVAGNGNACATPTSACGDGGPATAALLNGPDRAIPLADGGFLISEDQGHKVRKVSAAGVIARVAGTGAPCGQPTAACGDGGPATLARLNAPNGLAVDAAGAIMISDSNDNRIRKVSPGGVIATIAGNGVAGSFGDGVSARLANLNQPSSVAVAPDGSVVIADTGSHLVRSVKGGVIRTLAGTADSPCPASTNACGDGGPATSARLNTPYDVSVTPDGFVLVADHLDHRIRRVNATLGGAPTLRIQGRRLLNGAGAAVQLRGVNRAIFESRCTYDAAGYADGPADQASINAMRGWRMNAVRVAVNEGCWLGINGLPLSGNAPAYRSAVVAYVQLLRRNGLYVVIEPHFTAPGAHRSTRIDNMPDADHLPAFWRTMAAAFKNDHGIVFDAVNEIAMASWNDPHPAPAGQWSCWRNGCVLDSVYGGRFAAAGMQALINVIRAQGATQPIILGGLSFSGDLSQFLANLPVDPQRQLVASAHVYDFTAGGGVDSLFATQLEPIAARLPVILGELGERYCDSGSAAFTRQVLALIDGEPARGNIFGVLGWTWNARTATSTGWACPTGPFGEGGPLLVRDYAGTPTVMGSVFRNWFLVKGGAP